MAGFIRFTVAGVAFLLIAAVQTLTISSAKSSIPATLHHHLSAAFSLAVLLTAAYYSLFSPAADPLHLQLLPVAAVFLLHSLASPYLPDPIPHLLALSAFSLQFLLLYFRRAHPDGLENRYFDLLLVPVALSLLSALLAVTTPAPLLAGAAALPLKGTWFIQMGFSFFTDAVSHGCSLHRVSLGNFTLRCPAHMDAHRAAAVATLQFNCHLAGLLMLFVGLYAVFRSESGGLSYRPINQELQRLHTSTNGKFTLVEDDNTVDVEGVSTHKFTLCCDIGVLKNCLSNQLDWLKFSGVLSS